MAATKQTGEVSSAKSQWPIVDKAAFWKERNTVLKIVKFATSVIILPLALMSDIVNKTVNYAWSFKDVKVCLTSKKKVEWKESLLNGKTKLVNFWNNHTKKIIASAAIGLTSVALYYLFRNFKLFACQTICLKDLQVCQTDANGNEDCYPIENCYPKQPDIELKLKKNFYF